MPPDAPLSSPFNRLVKWFAAMDFTKNILRGRQPPAKLHEVDPGVPSLS